MKWKEPALANLQSPQEFFNGIFFCTFFYSIRKVSYLDDF